MKFEQVVKDAIESDVNSMEASSTEQAHTEAHENCGSQRRVRRPTKTVLTRCTQTHTTFISAHHRNLSFISAKICIVCVQIYSVNVLSIAGTLFLTLLTSDPSQGLRVWLNKLIFHDFLDFCFVCSMLYV